MLSARDHLTQIPKPDKGLNVYLHLHECDDRLALQNVLLWIDKPKVSLLAGISVPGLGQLCRSGRALRGNADEYRDREREKDK